MQIGLCMKDTVMTFGWDTIMADVVQVWMRDQWTSAYGVEKKDGQTKLLSLPVWKGCKCNNETYNTWVKKWVFFSLNLCLCLEHCYMAIQILKAIWTNVLPSFAGLNVEDCILTTQITANVNLLQSFVSWCRLSLFIAYTYIF